MAIKPWDIDAGKVSTPSKSRNDSGTSGTGSHTPSNVQVGNSLYINGTQPIGQRTVSPEAAQAGYDQAMISRYDRTNGVGQPPGFPPAGPGGPSSYRGGGGYGGGGSAAATQKATFEAYMAKVMEAMGGFAPGPDLLTPKINEAVDADVAASQAAYGGVADRTNNPYADLEFQQQQFDPQVAALMEAQGMGGDAGAAQAAGQSELDVLNKLWSNYGAAESARVGTDNQAFGSDRDLTSAASTSHLESQRSALQTAAEIRQSDKEEEYKMKKMEIMLALMGTGLGMGQDVSGLDLSGLL